MTFGEVLKNFRENANYKQEDLAKKLGVKKNTISNYENGISKPHYETLIAMCNLFQTDANTFMKNELEYLESKLPPNIQQLKDKYNNLTSHDKAIVDYVLNMESSIQSKEPSTIIYRFPVYEQQAAAGAGKYGREGKYEMEDITIDNPSHKAVFGVRISGDSMESDQKDSIQDKAIVLLNPNFNETDLEGRVVVFVIKETGEVLCKKFYPKHDHIEFISANNERQDLNRVLQPDEYIIIGEVVEIINPR